MPGAAERFTSFRVLKGYDERAYTNLTQQIRSFRSATSRRIASEEFGDRLVTDPGEKLKREYGSRKGIGALLNMLA